MKNLAGVVDCDDYINEELYLAGITVVKTEKYKGEVAYNFKGILNNWIFIRSWNYWIAYTKLQEHGLKLKDALELHNKFYPIPSDRIKILGSVIRSGGHCGAPSPDEYGAQPINEELIKIANELNLDINELYVGKVSELCNKGIIKLERYVDCYHIDTLIGLKEFASFVKDK